MSITRDQVALWLEGIAAGVIVLDRDNEGMARAALGYLGGRKPAPPPATLPPGNLTPHFTLAEFTASDTAEEQGIDNTPSDVEVDELAETAQLMELVRALCGGNAVLISSGYRCPELNAAVGGASNSAHLYGCAADIEIPDFGDPLTVCRAIMPSVAQLGIDQLIYETSSDGSAWVHVGRAVPGGDPPRGQCFSVINGATVNTPFPGD